MEDVAIHPYVSDCCRAFGPVNLVGYEEVSVSQDQIIHIDVQWKDEKREIPKIIFGSLLPFPT